mmetsp:Transcript_29890/g.44450  ORF Transcript_29890/g.44450 Transcript_29890/m.44450 type:complete len:273 (+) Transcript_29890:225-1043(+)
MCSHIYQTYCSSCLSFSNMRQSCAPKNLSQGDLKMRPRKISLLRRDVRANPGTQTKLRAALVRVAAACTRPSACPSLWHDQPWQFKLGKLNYGTVRMSRGGEGQLILRIGDCIGEGCLVVVKRHIRGRRGGVDGEADGIAVGGEVQCALRDECPRLPISVPSLDHEGCRVPRVAVTGRVHPHALDHGVRPGGRHLQSTWQSRPIHAHLVFGGGAIHNIHVVVIPVRWIDVVQPHNGGCSGGIQYGGDGYCIGLRRCNRGGRRCGGRVGSHDK